MGTQLRQNQRPLTKKPKQYGVQHKNAKRSVKANRDSVFKHNKIHRKRNARCHRRAKSPEP